MVRFLNVENRPLQLKTSLPKNAQGHWSLQFLFQPNLCFVNCWEQAGSVCLRQYQQAIALIDRDENRQLVEEVLAGSFLDDVPARLIGDKAEDSDQLGASCLKSTKSN